MSGAARPQVSVILPLYNGEAFLAETVDSVLAQTMADLELLIIDDGSRDGGPALVRSLAAREGRIRVLSHPGGANHGVSATRNLGAQEAAADVFAFIDADDVWPQEKLAHQLSILARHPEVGLVGGAALYWDSWRGGEDGLVVAGHRPDTVVPPVEAALYTYPLGQAQAPCPSTLMIRRALFETIGGFEPEFDGIYQLYEDQAFLAKCYLEGSVYMTSETCCSYRQHDSSIVASVVGGGRYHDVRRYFLAWLAGYIGRRGIHDARLAWRLCRAQLAYGGAVQRFFARMLDRLR